MKEFSVQTESHSKELMYSKKRIYFTKLMKNLAERSKLQGKKKNIKDSKEKSRLLKQLKIIE
jgi:hypothetical protein